MARATLKVRPQNRAASFDLSSIDADKRTVRLSFASTEPVNRYFGIEVLGFGDGECDLSRLNNGAALLLNHDSDCQIGVVESAEINGERGYATVRFSSSPQGQEIFKDVQDGIRTKVSVGYNVLGALLVETEGDDSTYRITDWQPYEVSIVSVPADDSVGVGRGANQAETEIPLEVPDHMKRSHILLDPLSAVGGGGAPAPVPVATVDHAAIAAKRANEVNEILAISDRLKHLNLGTEARKFIQEGKALQEFKDLAMARMEAQPINTSVASVENNMARELGRYSIVRAIYKSATGQTLDGIEGEYQSEVKRKNPGRVFAGFAMPDPSEITRAMSRALTTTAFSTGAALVDTAVLGSEYIELLRNRTVVDKLGIRMLAGLTANVALPRAVGGGTTYWLSDDGTNVTTSNQTFGQVGITPHTLIANTAYSKQLMAQASLDVEGLVRNDLGRVLGIEKDRVVLLGKGTAGEPLGVSKLSGVGSVTFGAAATWAKLLDFETQVAAANALQGNMAFVISPATRAKFKNQPKVGSTFPNFLFDQNNDGSGDGYINGYYGIVTNQVGTASTVQNQVIYGNWNDLIMASFAGLDVVVDPYSLSKAAQIQITITQWMDVAVRHAGSFCISSDSGAQ